MNESTMQDFPQHDATQEKISVMPIEVADRIEGEQSDAQLAKLGPTTVIPLVQNIETITSAMTLLARESRERTQQARLANATLKLIAFGTTLIALAILVGIVYLLRDVLALVVISFLIAYILSPIADIAERKGTNRTLVVIAMTLLILSSFAIASTLTVNSLAGQVKKLSEDVRDPATRERLVVTAAGWLNRMPEFLRSSLLAYLEEREETDRVIKQIITEDVESVNEDGTVNPEPLPPPTSPEEDIVGRERVSYLVKLAQDKISASVMGQSQQILSALSSSARGAFSAFTTGIIVLFLTFFMLNAGQQMKKTFIQVVPNCLFEPTLVLIDELDRQLGSYLRSRLIQTVILSILCAVGYWILGLRFAIMLGIIAGLANLIPYIGPLIGAMPAIIVVFLGSRFGIGWSLLAIVTLTLVVQLTDNAIITPLVIGKSVELGPVTTIVVVLLGEQMLGLIGLLMAVPIAAMCKLIFQEVWTQFKGYSRSIIHGH
ncbi:MAG: AI-2E family transporter [Candidatus Poribacteria bacterium]|nr:AI-2E family transporter [Candidatus Poribacteria bacterium]